MGPLKGDFLDIYVTTFFGVPKYKNRVAMRVIFFLKMLKLNLNFENAKKECQKVFSSEIIPSGDVPINCLY